MFRSGQQIGHYKLLSLIGSGGFGEVWVAERRTKFAVTQAAVKLPHDEQVDREAIKQEATLWARASGHVNVVPLIEANDYDGQIVFVSEYAPDGSLEQLLRQTGALPIKKAVELAMGILDGLAFLHSRHIIHRDLKPSNILLQGNTPRLADFGISRAMRTGSTRTKSVGTPRYMAPEAFDGERNAQTDIWSVGVILYQLLTNSWPFTQENMGELVAAIIAREPQPLPDSIPADLRSIVMKALDKQPARRYQTAGEMKEDLFNLWVQMLSLRPPQISIDISLPDETTVISPNVQWYPYRKGDKFGFCDTSRKLVIEPKYDFAYPFSEGLATIGVRNPVPIYQAYSCGVIDKAGSLIIPIGYDGIDEFIEGLATIKVLDWDKTHYGLIDKSGNVILNPHYGDRFQFSEGLAPVRSSQYHGRRTYWFVDRAGQLIIPSKYEDARPFTEGLALVQLNDKYGFIDKTGA
jgi:serine/threonine protein kinase